MKQTVEDYIRQDKEFRKTLLEQGGGIMKFWAQHPDAEFDANLFKNYENQIVKEYLQANKRNRDVVSLPENELKMEARSWNHHTEKEIHYKVALQPLMTDLPVGVREQVNSYIDDYLADAYRDYRRCYYPNGITPLAFYDEVVVFLGLQKNPYGYMRDCDLYVQPSRHEGYCITLAEALSFNKPVVVTGFSGAREQLVGKSDAWIADFSPDSLAARINDALLFLDYHSTDKN